MKNPVIRPVQKEFCQFDLGNDRRCPQIATMLLDSKALCDRHAALAMMAICGRAVQIKRGK